MTFRRSSPGPTSTLANWRDYGMKHCLYKPWSTLPTILCARARPHVKRLHRTPELIISFTVAIASARQPDASVTHVTSSCTASQARIESRSVGSYTTAWTFRLICRRNTERRPSEPVGLLPSFRRLADENSPNYKHDARASRAKTHSLAIGARIFSSADRLRLCFASSSRTNVIPRTPSSLGMNPSSWRAI